MLIQEVIYIYQEKLILMNSIVLNKNMFNDRKSINLADAQIGYITIFIQPSFDALSILLPYVKIQSEYLNANFEKWKSMKDEWRTIKDKGNDLVKVFRQLNEEQKIKSITKKIESLKKTANENNHLDDNI